MGAERCVLLLVEFSRGRSAIHSCAAADRARRRAARRGAGRRHARRHSCRAADARRLDDRAVLDRLANLQVAVTALCPHPIDIPHSTINNESAIENRVITNDLIR